MPLIKPTATTSSPTHTHNQTKTQTTTLSATTLTINTTATTLAKSVPVTPSTNYMPSCSPEGYYEHAHNRTDYTPTPHSYPNFVLDFSDDDDVYDIDGAMEMDEDSSLAMITPPPPYDTPHMLPAEPTPPLPAPPTRKFLFQNREIFNISASSTTTVPSSGCLASAITPTKLSAAAAAMFAHAPPMAQLNRKWTNLHRKRRRRNSSSGDSKELDKLVLQSVDWDENDIY